jgi:hypothetical protein
MKSAVIVICDSLRADLITPRDSPFLSELGQRSARFANHASVFPSTTRTSAASIATGCLPARHGLLGNTMAIDEGEGLVCLSVGKPDFRDRLHRATGRTLHMPTLAERVSRTGAAAIAISNVSPGAAYFLDPDGFGWVYNPAGCFGPGRRSLPTEEGLAISKGAEGDDAATDRFCEEVLSRRAPAVALLWLSEPDYTGHHAPLGSPAHRRAISSADENVRRVAETVRDLDPSGGNILFIVGSDHGMETVDETIDLDGLLIEAGLKAGPNSSDIVVAPNGTAALLYFADPAGRADRANLETRRACQSSRRSRLQPRRSRRARTQGCDRIWPAWRAGQKRAAPVPVRLGRRLCRRRPSNPLLARRYRAHRSAASRPVLDRNGRPALGPPSEHLVLRSKRKLHALVRGRARPGHPRIPAGALPTSADTRLKARHGRWGVHAGCTI